MHFLNAQLKPRRVAKCQVVVKKERHHGDTSGHGRANPLRTLKSTLAYTFVVSSSRWRSSTPMLCKEAPSANSDVAAECLMT
jgi:hypothetical protein